MSDCIFCKLHSGDAPARVLYRTAVAFAFFPLNLGVRGHTIVAPVRHVVTWPTFGRDEVKDFFLATQEVSELLCTRLSADSVNVLFAGGADAGQSVAHFHVHVLPRWRNDGVDTWPRLPGYSGDLEADFRTIVGA